MLVGSCSESVVFRVKHLTDLFARPAWRKAADSFGWLVVERGGRLVLGALVGLFVARHLGPERLGSLSYCIALVTLLGFLPELGLAEILRRDLLRTPAKTPELLASGLVLRLAAGIVSYAGVSLAAYVGGGFTGDERRLFRILGVILFQPALFLPELWLQAQLQAKRTTLVQLGALGVSSGMRLWLIHLDAPLAAFAWVIVGELVLCALGYFLAARASGLRFPVAAAHLATMQRLLGEAWPLMFASLAILVYMKIDEVMLRHLSGPVAVGIYAAAVKLSELWYFVPAALGTSVLPGMLRSREQGAMAYSARQQQYYDVSAAAAYVLSVPIALAAPWIVRLAYGGAFAEAGPILAVHIWASIFVFLGVARGQWLVNEGLQKFYLAATLAGAVLNVLLNLVLIPRWGGLGAAWATVASYAFAAWLASYLHPAVRVTAAMQTRALLIPFRAWSYLRTR